MNEVNINFMDRFGQCPFKEYLTGQRLKKDLFPRFKGLKIRF